MPLMGTPKSQLFTEQQLMKKAGTYHKRCFTAKDIRKAPRQDRKEGQNLNRVKTHTTKWVAHKWENNYNFRGAPR